MRTMLPNLLAHLNQLFAVLGAMLLLVWQELRDKRKRLRLTIEKAAERCGVDPSTYARWERGIQTPHPKNSNALLEIIDPDYAAWLANLKALHDSVPLPKGLRRHRASLDDVMGDVPDAFLPPSYWND